MKSTTSVFQWRLVYTVVVFIFVVMTILQLTLVLNLKATHFLAHKMMWTGSVLWLLEIICGWLQRWLEGGKQQTQSIWKLVIFTMVALGSVAGIYIHIFNKFALLADMGLWILFCAILFSALPSGLRSLKVEVCENDNEAIASF